jgi:SAM-dependent methyltransferase
VFKKHLPKDGTILEAGCGLSRWVIYFARLGYDIVGLDCNHEALRQAKSFEPSIKVLAGDLLETCFHDRTFDAVLSLGVVEHFKEGPQEALRELKRILKPGGALILVVPANNLFRILIINPLMRLRDLYLKIYRGHKMAFSEYRYSKKELKRFLTNLGFEIIDFATDDFRPPLSVGIYVDMILLTGKAGRKWRPGPFPQFLRRVLDWISPELACGGHGFVAKIPDE